MSTIRPPVPSPLFPAQTPPSPVRSARSDFFRAVLDGTQAAAGSAPVATKAHVDTPVATVEPPAVSLAPAREARPGALLDIRV